MIHPNPFITAFIHVPEWAWKNTLRRWLAFSRVVPGFIQNYSPLKGYESVREIQSGDVVVDAGAFPGDYTLFAARRVGPSGRVIAFEPGEKNRRVLERNLKKSRVHNVTVLPYGLWSHRVRLGLDANGLATSVRAQRHGEMIEAVPLDFALSETGVDRIDVLKMDIEGAELQALEGAMDTLGRCKPYTCVASYHLVEGENTSRRVEQLLRRAGLETRTGYAKHLTTYGWDPDPAPSRPGVVNALA